MALGSTQPLVKISTRNIPGDKGGRRVRLTSPPSCAECHEIWKPKPPGTLWATPGLLRDSFTFTVTTLRTGRLEEELFFLPEAPRSEAHPASCPMDNESTLPLCGRGIKLITHLPTGAALRMRDAIPPLPHIPSWSDV